MRTLLATLLIGAVAVSSTMAESDTIPLELSLLETLDSVIYIDGTQRAGDLPAGLSMLVNLSDAYKTHGVGGTITAVFDDDATAIVLSGEKQDNQVEGEKGNPYAGVIAGLIKRGVVVAVCGNDLASKGIGAGDLLPGVKVTPRGILLVAQLEKAGAFCLPTPLPGDQAED